MAASKPSEKEIAEADATLAQLEESQHKVDQLGKIYSHNRRFRVGKAFRGLPVEVLPSAVDGVFAVYFCHQNEKGLALTL